MIHDGFLKFASGQAASSLLSLAGVSTFYPFPSPAVSMSAADWLISMDKGSGYPIIARMDVRSALTSSDATLTFRLAAACSNANDGTGGFIIAAGAPTIITSWPTGSFQEIVIPKQPTVLTTTAFRYLLLGIEVTVTAITFGNALFTAGTFDAGLVLDTDNELRTYASGFTV